MVVGYWVGTKLYPTFQSDRKNNVVEDQTLIKTLFEYTRATTTNLPINIRKY